jgi:serine/threonine-protein kinase
VECPAIEVFNLLVAGQLSPEQRAGVADHAAGCRTCHELVAQLVTDHGRVQHHGNGVLSIGGVIGGRFRIDDILGVGGMGIVVAATHLDLRNRVAIKLMRDELLDSPAIIERFMREARAVVQLHTDHVCKVLDVARLTTGAPYIVMELLQGIDLARTIVSRPLAMTIAVEYVMQACIALAEAHAAGIVHRDLKPANLFVTRRPDGRPLIKVLDFGIAKPGPGSDAGLTHTRVMLGSPGYMSPEQLESPRDVDARSDIWALGVTLYQLLSARLPFSAPSQTEVAIKIAGEPPAPIDLDPALGAIIGRCLEKLPDRRYPDVRALVADLIPFGGPAARRIARTVDEIARAPIAVSVDVPPGLAYATTDPAPPQRIQPPGGVERKPAAATGARRSRTWWFVLLAIVVGNIIALAVLGSRSR